VTNSLKKALSAILVLLFLVGCGVELGFPTPEPTPEVTPEATLEPTPPLDPTPTQEILRCDGSPHDAVVLAAVPSNRCLEGEPIANDEPLPDADGIVRRFQFYPPGYYLILQPDVGVPYVEPGTNEYRFTLEGVAGNFGFGDSEQVIPEPGCYLLKLTLIVDLTGDDVEHDNFEVRLRVTDIRTGQELGYAVHGMQRLRGFNEFIVPFWAAAPSLVSSEATLFINWADQLEQGGDAIFDTYEYLRVPSGFCGHG